MWLGVKDDDLATAMATVATAPTGYSVVKVANNYNGTGSFTLTRTMMVKGRMNLVVPSNDQYAIVKSTDASGDITAIEYVGV